MNDNQGKTSLISRIKSLISSNFSFRITSGKKYKKELHDAVAIEVEKMRNFKKVGEGSEIIDDSGGESFFSYARSVFEQYDSLSYPNVQTLKKKQGKGNRYLLPIVIGEQKTEKVVESSTWLNLGSVEGYNPESGQTIANLRLQQAHSVYQWVNFPIARSEIENVIRYVLGRGVKIDCPVPDVLRLLTTFWQRNKMEMRNKVQYRTTLLKGEHFYVFFENTDLGEDDFDLDNDVQLFVRQIVSEEISEIEFDPDDFENVLSYTRHRDMVDKNKTLYYLDVEYPFGDEDEFDLPVHHNNTKSKYIQTQNERMMMIKRGLPTDVRGRVFLESILRWNRVYLDFLYDRGRLNHFRSKIFLVEKRNLAGGKVETDRSSSAELMPRGGIKLIETKDREYRVIAPETGAADAYTDAKLLLYAIGSAISMPIHVLNMNSENENYASIREAGTPFVHMIQNEQDDMRDDIEKLLRFVIKMAIRKGYIEEQYEIETYPGDILGEIEDYVSGRVQEGKTKEEIVEDVKAKFGQKQKRTIKSIDAPIHIIFPEITHSDPTKMATVIQIYRMLRLVSKHTAISKIGFDPEVEMSRIEMEEEEERKKAEDLFKKQTDGRFGLNLNRPDLQDELDKGKESGGE